MKEGWEYKKLGEVCRIERGGSPRPIKDFITNSPDGLNWIKIGDTDPQGKYIYSTKEKIKPEGLRKSRWVEVDEFLLSNSMSFGRPYILKTNGCIHDGWLVLRDYQNSLIIDYFYYLLISPHVQNQFRTKAQGSTVSNLNTDRVADVNIAFPPLSEQQSIVDYLDSAFAKIDAMKANAEKALNEAKALFQASLKEMLEPKEGWEEKKLGEVGTFIRGGNFSKSDFVKDGFPCVHYGQIHTKFGVATYEHLSCVPESMVKKERCASKGNLIIAITSEDDEGSCKCTAWMADYEAYVGGHTAIFKHSLNPLFVSYYFKASRFQKAKLEYTHGFKVVEISPKDIAKIPISYPSLSEQQSIVASLDSLKSKVDRLQENYDKISQECDALKQSILRQVFE